MSYVLAVILILTYIAMIVYAVKGGNLIVGFFIMAIIWAVVGGAKVDDIQKTIINEKVIGSASTVFAVIFGAWFGRVLVDTNIVSGIIKKAVELGGDKRLPVVCLLCVVSSAIFTSVYGVGTAMAIGLITLPIMFSLGVSKKTATTAFALSHSAGMFVNPAVFSQLLLYWPNAVYQGKFLHFALIACAVMLILCLIMLSLRLRKGKVQHAWAAQAPIETAPANQQKLFSLAYITPILPVCFVAFLKWEVIPALILSMALALLFSGYFKSFKKFTEMLLRTLRDGMSDVALLIGLMLAIWIYAGAATLCGPILKPLIAPILPSNPWFIAIAFGILCPLGLFRGPLTLSGVGAATISILLATAIYPSTFVMMLICVPWLCITYSACPTQSVIAWVTSYTKVGVKEHLKSTLPYSWIGCFILEIIMAFMFI